MTLSTHYAKRPGQRYLQTWHGTPLKRIGFDIERIHFRNKNYLQELRREDVEMGLACLAEPLQHRNHPSGFCVREPSA